MGTSDERFTNFLAFIITLAVFATWLIPAYMIYHGGDGRWGILYLGVFIITICWGTILWQKYFKQ